MTTIASTGASTIFSNSTSDPSAAEAASIDQSFAELIGNDDHTGAAAKEEFAAMTQNGAAGYWAWQVKQMREKAAAEVMASMNLTKEKIAAMDIKERIATEKKIEDLVEQKVKQEIAESSKKKQQQALVNSAAMTSIITNTQEVKMAIEKKKDVTAVSSNPSDPTDLLLFGS